MYVTHTRMCVFVHVRVDMRQILLNKKLKLEDFFNKQK